MNHSQALNSRGSCNADKGPFNYRSIGVSVSIVKHRRSIEPFESKQKGPKDSCLKGVEGIRRHRKVRVAGK